MIDIDAVSGLGESAPTSLQRVRDLGDNAKTKDEDGVKVKMKKGKGKDKDEDTRKTTGEEEGNRSGRGRDGELILGSGMGMGMGRGMGVKDEPISPDKIDTSLPADTRVREHDAMMEGDEEQDRDQAGRRLMTTGEDEAIEDINEAQKVDLSESESEEEEESMVGDFVQEDGYVSLGNIIITITKNV